MPGNRKPNFLRANMWRAKIRNNAKWKKPRGKHNKIRMRKRGLGKMPKIGYGTSSRDKFDFVLVENLKDISNLNKGEKILLRGSIGTRKKILMAEKAREMGLTILNIKDVEKFLADVKGRLLSKKQKSTSRKEKRKKEEVEETKKEEKKEDKSQEMEKKLKEAKAKAAKSV